MKLPQPLKRRRQARQAKLAAEFPATEASERYKREHGHYPKAQAHYWLVADEWKHPPDGG